MDAEIAILGIDPGTRITGYGVITLKEKKICPVDYGCIRPPVSYSIEKKHRVIFEAISELCEKHFINALAVEAQFNYKNPQSTMKLCMAKAIAMLAASLREIPVFEYAPTCAKKAVVGNGRAHKEQVGKMVKNLLGLAEKPEPEDAADALAIAICHAHTQKKRCTNPFAEN